MSKVTWRAWTTEGKFNSGEHQWEDLPDDGILVVVTWYNRVPDERLVRRVLSGDDWYFLQRVEGRADLVASNNLPPEENRRRYPGCILKRGKWIDDPTFSEMAWEAMETRTPP